MRIGRSLRNVGFSGGLIPHCEESRKLWLTESERLGLCSGSEVEWCEDVLAYGGGYGWGESEYVGYGTLSPV